jgi:hypothetical protein
LSDKARTDNSSTRSSRRIASNSSTFDLATSALPERRQQPGEPSGWGQIRPSSQVPGVSEVEPNQAVTVGPSQTDRATRLIDTLAADAPRALAAIAAARAQTRARVWTLADESAPDHGIDAAAPLVVDVDAGP